MTLEKKLSAYFKKAEYVTCKKSNRLVVDETMALYDHCYYKEYCINTMQFTFIGTFPVNGYGRCIDGDWPEIQILGYPGDYGEKFKNALYAVLLLMAKDGVTIASIPKINFDIPYSEFFDDITFISEEAAGYIVTLDEQAVNFLMDRCKEIYICY